jgi:ABC-type glycerol-3-phosphate transport system permease component
VSAFGIFFLRQDMTSIPDELLDSARIDGASESKIFWKIIVPLSRPALAAMAIFTFTFQRHLIKGLTVGAVKG